MIQITAYLRDEADLAKWKALTNKTEWLHIHLNIQGDAKVWFGDTKLIQVTQSKMLPDMLEPILDRLDKPLKSLCEHFQPKGSCMMKKCKYGKNKGG